MFTDFGLALVLLTMETRVIPVVHKLLAVGTKFARLILARGHGIEAENLREVGFLCVGGGIAVQKFN